MSGLAWKLRRLGAMTLAEIAGRVQTTLADAFVPAPWQGYSPEEAGERLFEDRTPRLARERWACAAHLPLATLLPGTLAAAAQLAAGRWTRFGVEVTLDDPPRWFADPATGREWPDEPSEAIDYRDSSASGIGAKAVWELGRLTFLPTLALAARHGDAAAGERARRWLADFVERNPLRHGLHHTSAIEMAIRNLTIAWTLALLDDDPPPPAAAGLVGQQALWCRDHLSRGSSANNHLLAEYAGMVVAGAGFPSLHASAELLDRGLAGLAREVPRQIHADGTTAEQALRYLPFVWELLLPAFVLAEAAGCATPETVRERLARSLECARALRRDDGTLPPLGDEDDARILLADETGTRLDLAGNALAAWLGVAALAPKAEALAILLTGQRGRAPWAAADGVTTFVDGGLTVWRAYPALATFDHGPLGLGRIAAHGHADALSITLRLGGDDLIVDPGTLAYHEDEARRTRTRATPSHATVHFGGRSQSEMLGPFLWGRRAEVTRDGEAWRCRWWSGEEHVRRVTFAPGEIVIEDRVSGAAAELVFPLAPGAHVTTDGARAEVRSGAATLTVDTTGIDPWRIEEVEVARAFGTRAAAPRLTARLLDREARTRLAFRAGS